MNQMMLVGEWRRAVKSLGAAAVLLQSGYSEDSVSQSCYAVLHAARSALFVHEVATSSHFSIRSMFGLHLVRSGEIERKWTAVLAETMDDRLIADYGTAVRFSDEEAQAVYERAMAFFDQVREYLHTKGVTECELALERGDA